MPEPRPRPDEEPRDVERPPEEPPDQVEGDRDPDRRFAADEEVADDPAGARESRTPGMGS